MQTKILDFKRASKGSNMLYVMPHPSLFKNVISILGGVIFFLVGIYIIRQFYNWGQNIDLGGFSVVVVTIFSIVGAILGIFFIISGQIFITRKILKSLGRMYFDNNRSFGRPENEKILKINLFEKNNSGNNNTIEINLEEYPVLHSISTSEGFLLSLQNENENKKINLGELFTDKNLPFFPKLSQLQRMYVSRTLLAPTDKMLASWLGVRLIKDNQEIPPKEYKQIG